MTNVLNKPAEGPHALHPLIRDRWSPRAFDAGKTVPEETLRSVLEAARWAPSAFNEQPWRFIVAAKQNAAVWERALACLVEPNQAWAKNASVIMLTLAKSTYTKNGKPNQHAWHDVGLAVSQMTLQAQSEGLYTHQMAGILGDKVRETFSVPEDYTPVTGIAMGYGAAPEVLPEGLAERERAPRQRHQSSDIFFRERFGDAF